jgi:hypothetical protein
MYLEAFNSNLYLSLLTRLENGLSEIQIFITSLTTETLYEIELLKDIYSDIFTANEFAQHVDFAITRLHKELYFTKVDYNRSNSYYHLKLIITSPELLWLDGIYNGIAGKILKYYKALFSKIDNLLANDNSKQKEACDKLIADARIEIEKLHSIRKEKSEINSEKKRLQTQHLEKIPFRSLFHITHVSNIPGILASGIFSHTRAHKSTLFKKDISNQSINQKRSRPENINNYPIHDYAPLYINPQNPMLESLCIQRNLRDDLVLIKVNPNILVNTNVLFTDGNAAEESSKFYNNLEDFNKLDWKVISESYYFQYSEGKRIKCSEVLVHEKISLPYIDELISFNENNFERIIPLFPNHINISLHVDKKMFY